MTSSGSTGLYGDSVLQDYRENWKAIQINQHICKHITAFGCSRRSICAQLVSTTRIMGIILPLWPRGKFLSTTRSRWTHLSLLTKFWGRYLNLLARKIHIHDTHGTQKDLHGGRWEQWHQEVSGDVTDHVRQFWMILRYLWWLEEQYPPGYVQLPKDCNRCLWRIVPLQKPGTATLSTYTTRGGDVCPAWKFRNQQDIPRKVWGIIWRCNVIMLPRNGTLCRKKTIINS